MKAFLCAVLFALCAPAWGAVVTGYFEGRVIGNHNVNIEAPPEVPDQFVYDISRDDARIGFSYSLDLAPPPDCYDSRCVYEVGNALSMWFEFGGGFSGASIPGTATFGYVAQSTDWGTDIGFHGDWDTSFGRVLYDSVGAGFFMAGSRHRLAGEGDGYTWDVEFEFFPARIQITSVPLPGTLALLAPLLYLTARTARSARRATPASRS